MLALTGVRSSIVGALLPLLPPLESVAPRPRAEDLPLQAERYLFAQGFLAGKDDASISYEERRQTYSTNFDEIASAVTRILVGNPRARIVVLGSESAVFGSFDQAYARSKAMLHEWVERTKLRSPEQQLVAVSPGIIGDAGMTLRRQDPERLEARERQHPKRRFITSEEVARLIRFLLYEDRGYLSGVVIHMNGGEGAWR